MTVQLSPRIPWAIQLPLPPTCYYSGWNWGPPDKFEQHYTAGCGEPEVVRETLASRGVSAHTCSGRRLYEPYPKMTVVGQFVPLNFAAAHSYEMAFRAFGNENAQLPGDCDLLEPQGEGLCWTTAYEIAYAEQNLGSDIPVVRSPGPADVPGGKCHADGFIAAGQPAAWNRNGHIDTPHKATGDAVARWFNASEIAAADRSPWSWDRALERIAELVPKIKAGIRPGEEAWFMPGLTDAEQQEVLDTVRRQGDYLDGVELAAQGKASAGSKASDLKKAGYRLHHALFPDARTPAKK